MEFKEFQSRISQCASNDDKYGVLWNTEKAQKLFDDLTKPALRPMETAPRDGTEILLYTVKSKSPMTGCYQTQEDIDDWAGDDIDLCKPGWFETHFYDREFDSCYMQVSDELRGWLSLPDVAEGKGKHV
jgi:hypothetical protein